MSGEVALDYEMLWRDALAVQARMREEATAMYCWVAGVACGIVAWIQLVLSTAPNQTLADEAFISEVMGGLWLLLGLLTMLWLTALVEHRREKDR